MLLDRLGKPWSLVRHVDDRPGHDRRYAMDGSQAGRAGLGAARRRSRTAWPARSTGSWPTRTGGGPSARATGTPTTSASTGRRLRTGASGTTPDVRVAVTGASGRLGSALVAALADAPFTGPAGPVGLEPGRLRPRRARRRDRGPRARSAGGRRPLRGVDRRRRLRPRPGAGHPAQRRGHRRAGHRRARPAASTCSSCRPTRSSTGSAPTVARTRPTTRSRRRNPYGASKARRRGDRPGRLPRTGVAPWASPGRPGCTARPVATSRARSPRPADAPPPPASRSGSSPTSGATPTYAADVADAIVELLAEDAVAGTHHLVAGGLRLARRLGRGRPRRGWPSTSAPTRSRARPGRAPRPRRRGPSSRRPRCRPASRSAPWTAGAWPTTLRPCAGLLRPSAMSLDRPPSTLPGVRFGAIARFADERGSFRELWKASPERSHPPRRRRGPGRAPSRASCRPT